MISSEPLPSISLQPAGSARSSMVLPSAGDSAFVEWKGSFWPATVLSVASSPSVSTGGAALFRGYFIE